MKCKSVNRNLNNTDNINNIRKSNIKESKIKLSPAQTIEQARKQYTICNEQIDKQDIIEANKEIIAKVQEFNKLDELYNTLVAKQNSIKLIVMNYMQFYTYLKMDDHILVSWKKSTRKTFDLSKFKLELPDLYETYLKEISTRNFKLH